MPHGSTLAPLALLLAAPLAARAQDGSAEPVEPLAAAADTQDWPQWRGPGRDGQAPGPSWPDRFAEGALEPAWISKDLGPSYSGPIVAEGRVFTTATLEEEVEAVWAFDVASGELLWEASWPGAFEVPPFAKRNGSWIRATPAYDDGALYVAGMRDVLVRLDAETGVEDWRLDLAEELETSLPDFGFVSSPLVHGDGVYVQAAASVLRIDKASGEIVWRGLTENPGTFSTFSSPIVSTVGGTEQLVVQTREELCGVDLASGDELWSIPITAFRGMNVLTPLDLGDAFFTTAYGGRAQRIDVVVEDGEYVAESAWNVGSQGYMTSPVLVDGNAYFFTRGNRMTCVDVATGEERWTSPPTGDEYWSLVAHGDRILALTNNGRLVLLAANPEEFEVLDELEVADTESWAHVAIAGSRVFVRSLDGLACLRWAES